MKCEKKNCIYNRNSTCIKSLPQFKVTSELVFTCADFSPQETKEKGDTMSLLSGGKQSVFKDIYWLIRHALSKDKTTCPRCGNKAFQHGFIPNERYYCTECNLWNDINE